jgi:hypothetical protein
LDGWQSQSLARSSFDLRKNCARNAGIGLSGWALAESTRQYYGGELEKEKSKDFFLVLLTIAIGIGIASITLIDMKIT